MSLKQFFVLFCSKNSVKPSIFKTKATINRHLAKDPYLQFKQFADEQLANDFLEKLKQQSKENAGQGSQNSSSKALTPQQRLQQAKQKIEQQILNKAYEDKLTKIKNHFLFKSFIPSPILKQPIPSRINLFFDGSSRMNPGPAAIGYVAKSNQNKIHFKKGWGIGFKTNNQAEFCALTWGLYDCALKGIHEVNVFGDSLLIINIMIGLYTLKNMKLKEYYDLAQEIQQLFVKVNYSHIDRSLNTEADRLARTVTDIYMQKN